APVSDELSISVWVKANRPGVQLLARVVLPHERNPQRIDEPLTTVIRGDLYQLTGRPQRLELRRPVKLLKDQQQLLRAALNRDGAIEDASGDRLLLTLYPGRGQTEVWIDDLEVGPVLDKPAATATAPAGPGAGAGAATPTGRVGAGARA